MNAAGTRRFMRLNATGLAVAGLLACGGPPAAEDHDDDAADAAGAPAAAEPAGLAALRSMTAPFTDLAAAQAAGYTDQITSCWYHRDQGGQGYHYGRTDLIDGTVSEQEPELVMYEPLADGTMQFLAVEYIVPFAAWEGAEAPTALGQTFMRNEQLELWVLHVWLGKENPSGMFANWNPNVSCAHAAESEDRA